MPYELENLTVPVNVKMTPTMARNLDALGRKNRSDAIRHIISEYLRKEARRASRNRSR